MWIGRIYTIQAENHSPALHSQKTNIHVCEN